MWLQFTAELEWYSFIWSITQGFPFLGPFKKVPGSSCFGDFFLKLEIVSISKDIFPKGKWQHGLINCTICVLTPGSWLTDWQLSSLWNDATKQQSCNPCLHPNQKGIIAFCLPIMHLCSLVSDGLFSALQAVSYKWISFYCLVLESKKIPKTKIRQAQEFNCLHSVVIAENVIQKTKRCLWIKKGAFEKLSKENIIRNKECWTIK